MLSFIETPSVCKELIFRPASFFFLKWAEKLAKSIKRAYLCSPQVIKTRAGVQEFTLKC